MLRAAADALAQRLLAALPPTRAYTRADLAGPDLPRPIGHFLLQSLDRRLDLEAEARRSGRSGWFRYDAPDVQAAEQAYWLAVGRYAQIPADEWQKALEQTVHQVVPYLVAPAQTLVHFVFSDDRPALPLPVVERRMRYFLPYPYLRDVVAAYAQQKGLDEITRDDFSRLLTRIEARTGTAYDADGLVALASDLFDTLGEGPQKRIAREHALRFFADKGLPHLVDRLQQAPDPVALADVRAALVATPAALLDDPAPLATPLPSPPVEEAAPPVPDVVAEPVHEAERPAVMPAAALEQAASAPGARWEQMAAPVAAPSRLDQHGPPPADATPLWKRFFRGDAVDDETLRLEQTVLGAGAVEFRKRLVHDLFGGDVRAYGEALARLAPLQTWAEASGAIAALFREHQVDLYGEAAVVFTDLAEQRFA